MYPALDESVVGDFKQDLGKKPLPEAPKTSINISMSMGSPWGKLMGPEEPEENNSELIQKLDQIIMMLSKMSGKNQ